METIESVEAGAQLASLLDRVAKGETFAITRDGVTTAFLVPSSQTREKLSHRQIVDGMRELRKRVKPGAASVRDMVEEGRRY